MSDEDIIDETETEVFEPTGQIVKVLQEGDPDAELAILQKKAALAATFNATINTTLVRATYPQDWTDQAGKMCLSSAGAERVGRMFPIHEHDISCSKVEWTDSIGKAYRYIFRGFGSMGSRTLYAEGEYSTRDKFLGFVNGEWRALEEINESNVRRAAYHILRGNLIKALLGIRQIPVDEFEKIMRSAGLESEKAGKVHRAEGVQGGTAPGDATGQAELSNICLYIAKAGRTVKRDTEGKWHCIKLSDGDDREPMAIADEICCQLSSFVGKEGKTVPGKPAKQLAGQRLTITLATAKTMKAAVDKAANGSGNGNTQGE